MLDLYHGQIEKDDVILCNTGNPLITEASDLFRGTSNQKRAARTLHSASSYATIVFNESRG